MKQRFALLGLLIICSCARDAIDPYSLAPSTPYASWTPMKGNNLVSSKYCKTLLPDNFNTGELNLAELLDIALQNNPSTKVTWAQARAASAHYGQSLSGFYPNIEFDASYMRQKGTFIQIGNIPNPYLTTQGGPDVTLSYTLFDFGQRTSAAMAAREALYYADLTHNQQIQNVMQNVMDDYYDYLFQMAVLRANEANLANAQMSLDAANERFSMGVAALGDVAQARTQFLQSRINLTTQKQNVEDAFAQLAVTIGLPANVRFRVQPLPDQVVANPVLESVNLLVERAQVQRQDFLARQASLKSKEASLLNAKRAILPVITSVLDVGHYWFDHGVQEKVPHWYAEINLKFPLFDGFYYKNGVRKAEADVEAAKSELMQTELSMIQDVTTSHMGVKTAALNLADSEEYLKAAIVEYDIALANYKAGTGTILDVLSAQSSLADARSKKAEAQKYWFASLAAIAHATGSICSTPNEEGPCESGLP